MRRCSLKKRKIAAKTRWQRELNQYPIFKPVDLSEFDTVARTRQSALLIRTKSNWETLEKWRKEALETKTPWQSDRSI